MFLSRTAHALTTTAYSWSLEYICIKNRNENAELTWPYKACSRWVWTWFQPIADPFAYSPEDMNSGKRSEQARRCAVVRCERTVLKLKIPQGTWPKPLKKNTSLIWRERVCLHFLSREKAFSGNMNVQQPFKSYQIKTAGPKKLIHLNYTSKYAFKLPFIAHFSYCKHFTWIKGNN